MTAVCLGPLPRRERRAELLPDIAWLGPDELTGLACARCRRRLPEDHRAARVLGTVRDEYGYTYTLWACRPRCARPTWERVAVLPRATAPAAAVPLAMPEPDRRVVEAVLDGLLRL